MCQQRTNFPTNLTPLEQQRIVQFVNRTRHMSLRVLWKTIPVNNYNGSQLFSSWMIRVEAITLAELNGLVPAELFAILLLSVTAKRNNQNSTKPEESPPLLSVSNASASSLLRSFHSLHTQPVRQKNFNVNLSSCVRCFFKLRLAENRVMTSEKKVEGRLMSAKKTRNLFFHIYGRN